MYKTRHTFMMRMNIIDICLRIPILYMYETDTVILSIISNFQIYEINIRQNVRF